MHRILIILKGQHGYNTDYLKMANYLAENNVKVDILCPDYGLKKIEAHRNINISYIATKRSKIKNHIYFNFVIAKHILKSRKNYNWILVGGAIEFCGIIPFLFKFITPKTLWIMDIRTCSVWENERKRKLYDLFLLCSSMCFDHITIISDLVAKRLKINKYTLLPLGADQIINVSQKHLDAEKINFLYVGSFENRNIDQVIKAYDIFCSRIGEGIQTRFDIVGFSSRNTTEQKILEAINNAKNKHRIIYHGRKSHDEIKGLFQEAAIGFSYIPITEYYDVQPPTKTFEYISNGIICIGTNTKANSQIINEENGILINEDIDSIVEGINQVVENVATYNSVKISKTVEDYTWAKIEKEFYIFLKKINLK